MKAPATKKHSSNVNPHHSKPFFNKNGEGSFFSQSQEAEQPFFSPYTIQPKLTIGQPNNPYEKEADAMTKRAVVQRKCKKCNSGLENISPAQDLVQLKNEDKGFHDYFKQCMEDLSLPAPSTLFETIGATTATIATLNSAVETFGTSVTIGELIGAGTLGEGLAYVGHLTAAYYAGACVGCLATAAGKSLSGGSGLGESIYDLIHGSETTNQRGLVPRGLK